MFTFWIFPIVFAALMMYFGMWLTKGIPKHILENTINLPIFYSTIIWLAIAVFNYAEIKDYFTKRFAGHNFLLVALIF